MGGLLLAQAVLDPTSSGVWERLGVAGILVVAATYMIRYFMDQLSKKETRLDAVIDRFIVATQDFTEQTSNTAGALRELRDVISNMERRSNQR